MGVVSNCDGMGVWVCMCVQVCANHRTIENPFWDAMPLLRTQRMQSVARAGACVGGPGGGQGGPRGKTGHEMRRTVDLCANIGTPSTELEEG